MSKSRRHHAVLTVILMVTGITAATLNAEEKPIGVIEAWSALDVPFETPHTDWAQPYAGGKIRVLFFTGKVPKTMLGVTRYVVETQQRFDIEADVVLMAGGVFGGAAAEQRMFRLIETPYDCYVMKPGGVFDGLPEEAKQTIIQNVRNGAGIVLSIGDDGLKDLFAEATALESLPEIPESSGIEAFSLDGGRLARAPIDRGWRIHAGTPRDKIFGVDLKRDVSYEATGRAILWAAGREPKLHVSAEVGDATMARGDLAGRQVKVAWSKSSSPLTISARFLNQTQRPAKLQRISESSGAGGTEDIPMPTLPAGDYWVHVEARSERGIEGWSVTPFKVTTDEQLSELNLVREWGDAGSLIEGSVKVDSPDRENRTLRVQAIDRYGRVLARRSFPAPEAEVSFTIPTASWMPNYIGVQAILLEDGEPICESYASNAYTIPKKKKDEWNFVMWGRMHAHQSLDIIEEMLARNGVTARIETTSTAWWHMSRAGMSYVAYCEAGLDRQHWHRGGTPRGGWRRDSISLNEHGEFQNQGGDAGCWNDEPAVDNRIRKWLQRETGYRQHGALSYSMGDEKEFVGSCLHPACMKKYRGYLKEQYGTIDALNESWSSSFASFEDVELSEPDDNLYRDYLRGQHGTIEAYNKSLSTKFKSFDEIRLPSSNFNRNYEYTALARGNLPRHFDRIAFQAWNFGKYAGRFQRNVRDKDPHAYSGVEGAGWIMDDIDIIVRNTDWWILYGIPPTEVVRSIAPRGYLIGHWTGYTDTNPKYPVSDFWLSFLRGGNSIGYWHTYNFLGQTLGPAPLGGGEVAETGRVVFDGLGKLLNVKSQMQHDGIVMLHSFASGKASYLQPNLEYGIYSGWSTNSEGDKWLKMGKDDDDHWKKDKDPKHGGCNNFVWHRTIRATGLQFEYVTDRMLRQGEFAPDDYKVMILPQCEALGPKEIAAIRKFAEDGGTVIADVRPAIYDGHLKLREGGGLDDLFGVRHTDNVAPVETHGTIEGSLGDTTVRVAVPDLRVNPAIELAGGEALGRAGQTPICIVNSVGRGRAILLNFPIWSFTNLSLDETPEADAQFIAALFESAGVEWPLRMFDEQGNRKRNIEAVRWKTGSGEQVVAFYGPLHDTRAQWRPSKGQLERVRAMDVTRSVRVELPEPKHVTWIDSDKPSGHTRSFTLSTRPWRPTFIAITDKTPSPPRLKPARRQATRGAPVHFEAELPGSRGLRALKVRVTTPDGAEARWFDKSVMVGTLGAQISFPIAINEQSGTWSVTATDLYTGDSASASFVVD